MQALKISLSRGFRSAPPAKLLLAAAMAFAMSAPTTEGQAPQRAPAADPWAAAQLLAAADFAHELAASKPDARPTIVYVGFRTLFEGGHIPGSSFHGTASTPAGLATLKAWASSLPRTTNVVIYCGCCPFDRCPNIRPAFILFRDLGFTRLRVLALPTSFAADWAGKNYPFEKGL